MPRSSTASQVSQSSKELLDKVRAETVSAEGTSTKYGVSFTSDGYQTLLSWHCQYKVTKAQARAYEALDLTLPCCAFGHPSADEEKNWGCGHHQALYGLSKRLFDQGYGTKATQAEVSRWGAYFFPRETLLATLNERAGSDPQVKQALEELKQNGGC